MHNMDSLQLYYLEQVIIDIAKHKLSIILEHEQPSLVKEVRRLE